jgi:hypothetical protein
MSPVVPAQVQILVADAIARICTEEVLLEVRSTKDKDATKKMAQTC